MNKIKLSPYHKIFYNEWQLDPSSSKYNIVFDQTFSKTLDVPKLTFALERFVAEHFIINSHIIEDDNELYWVSNTQSCILEHFDSYLSPQIYEYVSRPFDLRSSPLYRFAIFNEFDGKYRLILVLHHIIIDGNSFDEFIMKISHYYNNIEYKNNINIDEQKQSIDQTVSVINEKINSGLKYSELFWRNVLINTESVDLRFVRCSTVEQPVKSVNGHIGEFRFEFSADIFDRLIILKNNFNITPNSYGINIFAILLNRYNSQSNFAIAYPTLIKEHAGLIYGAGVTTSIYPFYLKDSTTLLDLFTQYNEFIQKSKDSHLNYYPINKLIAEFNRDVFDVFFAQTKLRDSKFIFNNVETISVNKEFNFDVPTKFLLEYELSQKKLSYRLRYDATQFDPLIIEQFINHYKKIFVDILIDLEHNDTNKLISSYQILSEGEYKKILYEWNQTYKQYPENKTIHALFEEQVKKTPNNVAIAFEGNELTYSELNVKSNQLANYMKINCDINQGELIALCLDRNEYMLIAIMAVLKSGKAYVPMDIKNYPDNRIIYVLKNTKAEVILTNEIYVNKISNITSKQNNCISHIIAIDSASLQSEIIAESIESLNDSHKYAISKDLAYVIYTSGTTGNPKGVMVEHRSVINYVTYLINDNNLGGSDVGSQYTGFDFDALVIEIYPILLSGAKLCIIKEEDKLDPVKINNFFIHHKVTYAFLPPQIAQMFFAFHNTSLKNLIVGGDKLHKYNNQNYRIINAYGPTETTVQSNRFIVDKFYNNIPIGKPIRNVTNYILDANLSPLPVGAIGELFIGGDGVTRGYLNNPELTKERFIANPFQSKSDKKRDKNDRIYKTGDLVRYLSNGNIEYIGRNDFQVKIRGYRIELGDIETTLSKYPGIKECVVLALDHENSLINDPKSKIDNSNKIGNNIKFSNSIINEQFLDEKLSEQGVLDGKLDMLPIQEWFFNQDFINVNYWNQSFLIRTPKLNKDLLRYSIVKLVEYHDSFRLRYKLSKTKLSYTQYYANDLRDAYNNPYKSEFDLENYNSKSIYLRELDITQISYKEGTQEFNNELYRILTDWQSDFNIENGPLSSFGYISGFHDGSTRVYFALHHLLIDTVSWRIILNDLQRVYTTLETAYQNGCLGEQMSNPYLLGKKSTSYRQWIDIVKSYSSIYVDEKNYWIEELLGYDKFNLQLLTLIESENSIESNGKMAINLSSLTLTLDKDYTDKLITKSMLAFNNQINDMLLTALAFGLNEFLATNCQSDVRSSPNSIYINLEGHGREDINSNVDITRTIGWFTTMFPVKLTIGNDLIEGLNSIKETLLAIPNKGVGYGALFGYSNNLPLISFNYLGQINHSESNDFWSITGEPSGQNISYVNKDHNILNINGWIVNKQLIFNINSQLNQDKLNQFADLFKIKLINLIDITSKIQRNYLTRNMNNVVFQEHKNMEYTKNNLVVDSMNLKSSYVGNKVIELHSSTKYLVAYYVSDSELNQNIIKDYLLKHLPQYLVPAVFIWLHAMPLTLNGKLDRASLSNIQSVDVDEYIAPQNQSEYLICNAFAKILGKKRVGINDDFFTLGGDSILAITLTMSLQANFYLNVRDIFTFRTPNKLAQNITLSKDSIKSRLLAVMQEHAYTELLKNNYKEKINPKIHQYLSSVEILQPDVSKKKIKTILLTGATGYLGCNILNQLLELTDYNIYAFVRASSEQAAIDRINHKYKLYFSRELNKDNFLNSRVFILAADIERPDFGITEDLYVKLLDEIDSVIHVAALIKQFGNYDIFYMANVQTTINLLEFSKLTKLKDFHYISTLSLLKNNNDSCSGQDNCYIEDDLPDELELSDSNIYLKTKLEAERQLMEYRNYGINTNIYRVGNLAFMLKDCSVQENIEVVGFTYWLKYMLRSKRIFSKSKIEISPVDLTAKGIVKLFDKKCSVNKIYHLFNPHLFDLVNYMQSNKQISIKILSMVEFIKYVIDDLDHAIDTDLILRFLLAQGWLEVDGIYQFAERKYLQAKTQYILKLLNFEWSPITNEQFNKYLNNIFKITQDLEV